MNILIFAANWYNHGDEAALRAMIDELKAVYPHSKFKIQFNQSVESVPYDNVEILNGFTKPMGRNKLKHIPYNLSIFSGGRLNLLKKSESENFKRFIDAVKWADYAIYAPGGPSIGDRYHQYQLVDMMLLMKKAHLPYSVFAPSMGPFSFYKKKIKQVLDNAAVVCFREGISQGYYNMLSPDNNSEVTLDSAFQHPVDVAENQKTLNKYNELDLFLKKYNKVVGITVTDLKWHRDYCSTNIGDQIDNAFRPFISELQQKGYGILFIPQLFGKDNDADYMRSFAGEHCFVMSEDYDCYFQQYVISKLYAVVGMRYHSNIFSAKMGTPFLSVAYEQKMTGFMKRAKLEKYCIMVNDLSADLLSERFTLLENDYNNYKEWLNSEKEMYQKESHRTTDLTVSSIELVLKNSQQGE